MEGIYNYSNLSSPIDDSHVINYQFISDLFIENQKEQIFHNDDDEKIQRFDVQKKKPIYRPHCKWSKEEDEKLKELVKEYGENEWRQLAKKMEGRNTRQCRERWKYYLNPMLKQGHWTIEEDQMILKKYHEYGPRWIEITKYFEHRTDAMIKNRYSYLIRNEKRLKEKNEFPVFDSNLKNEKNAEDNMIDQPMIKSNQYSEFNSFIDNSCSFDSNENENDFFEDFEIDSFFMLF